MYEEGLGLQADAEARDVFTLDGVTQDTRRTAFFMRCNTENGCLQLGHDLRCLEDIDDFINGGVEDKLRPEHRRRSRRPALHPTCCHSLQNSQIPFLSLERQEPSCLLNAHGPRLMVFVPGACGIWRWLAYSWNRRGGSTRTSLRTSILICHIMASRFVIKLEGLEFIRRTVGFLAVALAGGYSLYERFFFVLRSTYMACFPNSYAARVTICMFAYS